MTLIDTLNLQQIEELHRLYRHQWWTGDRTLEETRSLVRHSSLVLGFLDEGGCLAAFARVLSDFTVKAMIFDVIVSEAFQGQGVGKALMNAIHSHPELRRVRHFELYCLPEMAPYYESLGFRELNDELLFMRRERL